MRPPWWGGVGTRKEAARRCLKPVRQKIFLLASGPFLEDILEVRGAEKVFSVRPQKGLCVDDLTSGCRDFSGACLATAVHPDYCCLLVPADSA